jgi:DUF971 family protein
MTDANPTPSTSAPGTVAAECWPTDIVVSPDKRLLSVTFEDGTVAALDAELLRVTSPSAEVQGHSASQRVTVPGKRHVSIKDVRPVGNYAVQIVFDDGHDTGYYRWPYLYELGRNRDSHWGRYLEELAAKGLTRG